MSDEKQRLKNSFAKGSPDGAPKVKSGDGGKDQSHSVKPKKVAADGSVIKKEQDSGGLPRKDGKTEEVKLKQHSSESVVKVKKELETVVEVRKQSESKVKKETSFVKTEKDSAEKSKVSYSKIEKKQSGKLVTKKSKSKAGKVAEKEKQKKVYELPGQKHDPPEERDPLRIFYQSLYEQIPTSEMAEVWMMEHGLLPKDVAKKAYERKQKRQQQQKLGTPTKPSPSARQTSSKTERFSSSNGKSKTGGAKVLKASREYNSDDEFLSQPKKRLKLGS